MKKYYLKTLFFLGFMFLASCYAKSDIMTTEKFYEVDVGISESALRKKLGPPYAIKHLGLSEKRYEYIERVVVDERLMNVRYYYFIIKDGKVTSKSFKNEQNENRPLLERNAYDLQTSYNK